MSTVGADAPGAKRSSGRISAPSCSRTSASSFSRPAARTSGGEWPGLVLRLASAAAPGPVGKAATLSDATTTVLGWISRRFGSTTGSNDLEVSTVQLLKDGSLSVPLAELDDLGFVARRLSNFLWIAYTTTDGTRPEYTFSGQVALPGGWAWEKLIREIREAGHV